MTSAMRLACLRGLVFAPPQGKEGKKATVGAGGKTIPAELRREDLPRGRPAARLVFANDLRIPEGGTVAAVLRWQGGRGM